MLIFALLFAQSDLYAQKYCVDCKADVKVVSDKQVLLEKIDLKSGTPTTSINTNLYVSYRSGNSQKFWTNLVIATAGVAVSTQLNNANLAEGKSANGISPLLPLGVSVATLPSIWKNRPRNVPQAGLWIQHRDTRGKLLETWEQPISSEAKNDAELLTVSIDKPLTAGTLEVYLQNGSKNGVYYWGYETTSKSKKSDNTILQNPPVSFSIEGCPDGYLPNGNGMCCNPFTGDCVNEGGGTPPPPPVTPPTPTTPPIYVGCPAGYLSNGQGMCCDPFTGNCFSEGVGNSGGGTPITPPTTPPSTLPISLQNAAQGCPAGYLPNGQGMCCDPFTGNCTSERVMHDPTSSNFVSSFNSPAKPPCAIWVCTEWGSYQPYPASPGVDGGRDCGWLEYQCPTAPVVPPFPDPTPAPPINCGPDFHFDGTYCIPNNPSGGGVPFTPIPYTGTGTTGTGNSGGGSGGNNTSNNGGCTAGNHRNSQGVCEQNPATDILIDIVSNNVTNLCIKSFLSQLNDNKYNSKIVQMYRDLYAGSIKISTIVFKEDLTLVLPAATFGREDLINNNTGNMLIKLNHNLIPNTKEFIASLILHEILHAIITEYSTDINANTGPLQHLQILNNWVSYLRISIKDFFPLMTDRDALGLALGGLDSAFLNLNDLQTPQLTLLKQAKTQFDAEMLLKYGMSATERDKIITDFSNSSSLEFKGSVCGL